MTGHNVTIESETNDLKIKNLSVLGWAGHVKSVVKHGEE